MEQHFHNRVEFIANEDWDPRILVYRCALHDGGTVDHHCILTQRYVILIDTALNSATAELLLANIRPYLTDERQLLVINTHADWDHAWGNQVFAGQAARQPAPIIASRLCAERLRSPETAEQLTSFRRSDPQWFGSVVLTAPTILFDRQLQIDGGDLQVELFATPGHTADHISVYLPEIRTLFVGDAAEVPFPFVDGAAAIPAIRASLRRLAAYNAATVLYCHAPVTAGPAVIEHNIAYFDRLEQHCRAAVASGLSREPEPEEDAAACVGFPLAAALPPGLALEHVDVMYECGHQHAVRAMLKYLRAEQERTP